MMIHHLRREAARKIFQKKISPMIDSPQQPPTVNHQPPPTANRHQPATTNCYQPPPTASHQQPTASNHQPPIAICCQAPPTTNHQPPTYLKMMSASWGIILSPVCRATSGPQPPLSARRGSPSREPRKPGVSEKGARTTTPPLRARKPIFPHPSGTTLRFCPDPPCDIPLGDGFFTGPWTVTRSPLRVLRRVNAF